MALPAGFSSRPIALEGDDGLDVDAVFAVVHADNTSVLAEPDETREAVRSSLVSPDAVIEEHRLVTDANGNAVAALLMEREGSSDRVFFDAYCRPELKADLLPGVIELALEAAPRIAPGEVRSAGHADDHVLMGALKDAGFAFLRRFWRMRIELEGHPVDEPVPPSGVTKSLAVSENERRLLHSVHTSAFADHFGAEADTYEEWFAWVDDRKDARPDLRWIAWCDGDVVAECTADDSRAEFDVSYIRTLSVLPAARGKGIGRWLLQCQLAHATREGRIAALLTVDSTNTTGATALYESVGMRPVQVIDLLARP